MFAATGLGGSVSLSFGFGIGQDAFASLTGEIHNMQCTLPLNPYKIEDDKMTIEVSVNDSPSSHL